VGFGGAGRVNEHLEELAYTQLWWVAEVQGLGLWRVWGLRVWDSEAEVLGCSW